MNCALGEHLIQQLEDSWRKQEHHEIMRLTRELTEHKDKCPVCQGILAAPAVPLEDQLFKAHVIVRKQ